MSTELTDEESPEETYEELLAKITHPKQRAFLENYPKFGVSIYTAKAVGVSDYTSYYWQNKDENYRLAFLALKKHLDTLRARKIRKRAREASFRW